MSAMKYKKGNLAVFEQLYPDIMLTVLYYVCCALQLVIVYVHECRGVVHMCACAYGGQRLKSSVSSIAPIFKKIIKDKFSHRT